MSSAIAKFALALSCVHVHEQTQMKYMKVSPSLSDHPKSVYSSRKKDIDVWKAP